MARRNSACPAPAKERRLSRRHLLGGLLLLPVGTVGAQTTEVVVIVHPDNPHAADRVFVQRLYTGALRGWPDGQPALALDLPEDSVVRAAFSQQWLGRSVANVRAVWAQNIFTGKGLPPRVATPETEIRRLVASNRNAIGYVAAATVNASVKSFRL